MSARMRFSMVVAAALAVVLSPSPALTRGASAAGGAPQRIAFASWRGGDWDVYLVNADGSGERNLTRSRRRDDSPAWSPDGRRIAFTSVRDGFLDVYVMNADGSGQRKLTRNQAIDSEPAWSPDGRKIAFWSNRDGNFEIYVMDADGRHQRNLTRNKADDSGFVWSPDGRRIAFVSDRKDRFFNCRDCEPNAEIYVMDADGSHPQNLTRNEWSDSSPAWSPDGRQITFTSNRGQPFEVGSEPDGAAIYVMDADGHHTRILTPQKAYQPSTGCGFCGFYDTDAVWSPDGRMIGFESDRDGYWAIYLMNADGSNQRRVTSSQTDSNGPVWSTDGRSIAFLNNHDGYIHVMNADGSGQRALAPGYEPAWSPTPPRRK